jgi:poly(3-hydroxybutyrate) depolymerase
MRSKVIPPLFAMASIFLFPACRPAPSNRPGSLGDGGSDAGDNDDAQSDADGPVLHSPPPSLEPAPSTGCGSPISQELAKYVTYTIHTTGATLDPTFHATPYDRGYAVWLPPGYDSSVPHRAVFIASGCGSSATSENRYMALDLKGDRGNIYVGLDSPPASVNPGRCFDNTGAKSTEWEFFALVTTAVERTFCVDRTQELIAGTASGATLANMLGCYFSGADRTRAFRPDLTLRAQFSVAGAAPVALPPCGGPVAAFWMHDLNEFIPPTGSLAARDRVLATNGCAASPAEDWGASTLTGIGCKKYSDCSRAFPVIFCETVNRGRQSNYYDLVAPAMDEFLFELSAPP